MRVWGVLVSGLLALTACKGSDEGSGGEDSNGDEKSSDSGDEGGETVEDLDLDSRAFPLLIWSAYSIQQDFFDRGRFSPKAQLESSMDELGLHTPEFFGAREGDVLKVTVRSSTKEFPIGEVTSLAAAADVLEQVLVFVRDELKLEGEPLHELEYAAINGFLAPLDANTILLTPEERADLGVKTRGSFGGIGAEISAAQRRIVVVRVLPDSPALKAGLFAADVILEIDGQSTVNMELVEAQELLRGPVKTKVKVKIQRGQTTVDLDITRDTIRIESVRHQLLPEKIGYLSISTFQEDTADKTSEALRSLKKEAGGELAGLVVDLRGNSGGLLTKATEMMDMMTDEGELIIMRSTSGREAQEATEGLTLPEDVPVVALVDERSASAAEILSGSIKHLGRGVVVGRPSFGKGTVQWVKAASPYGRELALKLTIAEYRVAGERKIQSVGVRPDLELVPVQLTDVLGVARYYDDERFDRARGHWAIQGHPSAVHEEGADAFVSGKRRRVRYLDNRGLDLGYKPPEDQPEQMGDPEIRLAHDVAKSLVGTTNRSEAEAKLDAAAKAMAAAEDESLEAAMKKVGGVDWEGEPDTSAKGELELTAKLPEDPVAAGEPFKLALTVQNTGSEAVDRVHVTTDCGLDELDGIELLVGHLEPGASAERVLELYVMPWHRDLMATLQLQAESGEPDGELEGSLEAELHVEGAPRPRFAFDYWIVDDPELAEKAPSRPERKLLPGEKPFEVKGNGDGILQPGEQVLLAFHARNSGEGMAPDARAVLRNLSGTQGLLEEGEVLIGKLAPGKEATGAFGISVSPAANAALPMELEIVVGDGQVRERVDDRVRLRIVPDAPAFEAEAGHAVARSQDVDGAELANVRLHVGAHDSAAVIGVLTPGSGVKTLGKAGRWIAIEGEPGQRLWASADLFLLGEKGSGEIQRPEHLMVDPPVVELSEIPRVATSEQITIAGTARHADRVRDVVVQTLPTDGRGQGKKVFYLENPAVDGKEAGELAFSTTIDLQPGANRILIRARDADKVERREEVWVYRK